MININFTIADCEYVWYLWCNKKYEEIEAIISKLNPLEAMKLAKHLIIYHDEDACVINGISNFISNDTCRAAMIYRRGEKI